MRDHAVIVVLLIVVLVAMLAGGAQIEAPWGSLRMAILVVGAAFLVGGRLLRGRRRERPWHVGPGFGMLSPPEDTRRSRSTSSCSAAAKPVGSRTPTT